MNDNNRKIVFKHLIDIYSKMEQKPTMEEYDKVKDYMIISKNEFFMQLFKDDWKDYLVMILQQCIEPIKI